MPQRMRLAAWFLVGVLALGSVSGCVERRMVIASDPYGAIVYDEKNTPIGAAPVDRQFTHYGVYKFTLAKDGYETMVVEERVRAPWYSWFGLDFISENLIPFTFRDVRVFRYTMQPVKVMPPETLMQQAELLRAYGQTKGSAILETPMPMPGPSTPPMMPAIAEPPTPTPVPPGLAPPAPAVPPPPGAGTVLFPPDRTPQ